MEKLTISKLTTFCHTASVNAGWYNNLITGKPLTATVELRSTKLMLIVSEVSEAFEGMRKNLNDDHLPHRKMEEVELADALIRIFDYAGFMGYDLEGAVIEKLAYNLRRPDHKIENRTKDGGKQI